MDRLARFVGVWIMMTADVTDTAADPIGDNVLNIASSPRRWRFLVALALVFAAQLQVARPAAAAYPDHTVKVVVGFAPGGTNDILARIVAAKLQERLKQSFIVENRMGR